MKEIDEKGNQLWHNVQGNLHRENGPAVIYPDGSQFWYKNSELHRIEKPAIIYANGNRYWFENNNFIKYKEEK